MGDLQCRAFASIGFFTLTCLILLLVSPRAALADPIADFDKSLPNVETGNPPPEANSRPATEQPAGSDPEATPVLLRGVLPAASDTAGGSTGRSTTVESSEQPGDLTPALVPGRVPTGKSYEPSRSGNADTSATGGDSECKPAGRGVFFGGGHS
jgi:hypothetical protein